MPGISLDDRGAWDDSALVSSWDEAVAEYQKYHSIQRSGKRLEDVLSEEELRQLRDEHEDLMDIEGTADRSDHATHELELAQQVTNGDSEPSKSAGPTEEHTASGHQDHARGSETVAEHKTAVEASMPHALLGTVQDENTKNLMMSWYYAGYYTGLHAGQQQGPPASTATPKYGKS